MQLTPYTQLMANVGARQCVLTLLILAGLLATPKLLSAQVSVCSGAIDNFTCPSEQTVPDGSLDSAMSKQYADVDSACFGFLDFDEFPGQLNCSGVSIPKTTLFMHQMTFVAPGEGFTSGTLTFRLKAATAAQTSSDFIAFFEGATFITGAGLSQLPGSTGVWNPDQTGTFSLDLADLPSGFVTTNILQYLNDGDLDIMIGNGTAIDWICLEECNCPCRYDPSCDGSTDVLDVVQSINVAFRNNPATTDPGCPLERSDVDGNGSTDVLDVVKIVNVAFRNQTVAGNFVDPCQPDA